MLDMNRRAFIQTAGLALGAATAKAHPETTPLDRRNERTDRMLYRRLGGTNFNCSALIFGCGAALQGGRAVRLLDQAFDAGINYFDVGSNDYYKNAENHLAPFAKAHRDEIWITSKGYARSGVPHEPGTDVSVEHARVAAAFWTRLVEQSLKDLDTDYIDAYMVQGSSEPSLVRSEEMAAAFESVKASGKVGHVGLSSHQNAHAVVEAALETDWYDLIMIAVNPAGWYDWKNREMLANSPSLRELRPLFDRVRAKDIGIIGMKAGRYIAPAASAGRGEETAYDRFYGPALMHARLTPHQRDYAFVVQNGLDAVNADMQNFRHFEENLAAVVRSPEFFA
jgi:hypothetical protein